MKQVFYGRSVITQRDVDYQQLKNLHLNKKDAVVEMINNGKQNISCDSGWLDH